MQLHKGLIFSLLIASGLWMGGQCSAAPLAPATSDTNLVAAMNGRNYSLTDPQTGYTVATATLPSGWIGLGKVARNKNGCPSWFTLVKNLKTDAMGQKNSALTIHAMVPCNELEYWQSPALLAKTMGKDMLQSCGGNIQNFKVTAAAISPSNDSNMLSYVNAYAAASCVRPQPYMFSARFSFNRNGQPWKGGIEAPILCANTGMMSLVQFPMYFYVASPAGDFPATMQTVGAIFPKIAETGEWNQYFANINQQITQKNTALAQQTITTITQKHNLMMQSSAEWDRINDEVLRIRSEQLRGKHSFIDEYGRRVEYSIDGM